MRNVLVGACVTLALALGVGVGSAAPGASLTAIDARKPAPALSLKDSNKKTIRLSDYKGRVVLLDFWATWCTGCKVEMPWFMDFDKKYSDKGLSTLGVAVDEEGWRTVKVYLAEHPVSYPVVLGNFDTVEKTFKLPASLPQTLLIDRSGRIAATHSGVVDKDKFEADLQQLLGEATR